MGQSAHLEARHDVLVVSHYKLNTIHYLIQLSIPSSTRYLDWVYVNSYDCRMGDSYCRPHPKPHPPRSQVKANWIALLPVPQKASTMTSQRHRSARCSAIFSGVALNQPSNTHYISDHDVIVMSYLYLDRFRCHSERRGGNAGSSTY